MVHLGDVNPSIWDQIIEIMEEKLKHLEFQEEDIILNWRIPADTKMLDRELYEKYGMFKDIILHPTFQYVKNFLEENVVFDLVLGDPIMPFATAVIILFMLHKRVSNNIILLIAAFIFNINPFYICSILILWYFTRSKKRIPKLYKNNKVSPKRIRESVVSGMKIYDENNGIEKDVVYDHVLVGNDLSTLFTAALLSKNGHKVSSFFLIFWM